MRIVASTDIEKFAADVTCGFLPEKVILFGSYLKGTGHGQTDAYTQQA